MPNKPASLTQKFWQKILPEKPKVQVPITLTFVPTNTSPKHHTALDIANGLAESIDLIELSLIQNGHLTPIQAKTLSLKLSYAADKVRAKSGA